MTIKEAYRVVDREFSFRRQPRWDRSGLFAAGDPNAAVTGITFALDLDERVLAEAARNGSNLVVVHHPVFVCPANRRLLALVKRQKVAFIACHMPFDQSPKGMNFHLARALGLKKARQAGNGLTFYGELAEPLDQRSFALHAARAFKVKAVVAYPANERPVFKVALTGGAGMGHVAVAYSKAVKADAYVTGDVRWHDYHLANQNGVNVFDVGHHAEQIIIDVFCDLFVGRGLPLFKVYPLDQRVFY